MYLQVESGSRSVGFSYVMGVENSVDPNQLASQKPADLDIHCLQNRYIHVSG